MLALAGTGCFLKAPFGSSSEFAVDTDGVWSALQTSLTRSGSAWVEWCTICSAGASSSSGNCAHGVRIRGGA